MLRSQRIILIIALIVLAALVHTHLCEWRWRYQAFPEDIAVSGVIVFWTHPPLPKPLTIGNRSALGYTGIFAEYGVDRSVGLLAGVALPLGMLIAVSCLMLGWRAAGRVQRGLCTQCGYDLRGNDSKKCPECGKPA